MFGEKNLPEHTNFQEQEDMIKKYKSRSAISINVVLDSKKSMHIAFTAQSDGGSVFITDNKIFRSKMSPVDFRNLIGRVGRISYNLYGNVFFVSEEKSVPADSYIEMLQTEVPEQVLSITSNPKVLKSIEKKYIAEILKEGHSEIPKRTETQSEESYVMMRKFGLH